MPMMAAGWNRAFKNSRGRGCALMQSELTKHELEMYCEGARARC